MKTFKQELIRFVFQKENYNTHVENRSEKNETRNRKASTGILVRFHAYSINQAGRRKGWNNLSYTKQ
jgi:hypothetical protein